MQTKEHIIHRGMCYPEEFNFDRIAKETYEAIRKRQDEFNIGMKASQKAQHKMMKVPMRKLNEWNIEEASEHTKFVLWLLKNKKIKL